MSEEFDNKYAFEWKKGFGKKSEYIIIEINWNERTACVKNVDGEKIAIPKGKPSSIVELLKPLCNHHYLELETTDPN